MKNSILALRSLLKKGQNNHIKILSLGVGLAMGLVLIAKICFEYSYDNFYPDNNRIYQLQESVSLKNEADKVYGQVSGGVAPGMKAEIPEVEAATRVDNQLGDCVFFDKDKNRYSAQFLFADTAFYDVFPRPVLLGNVQETLGRPGYAIVSRTMAETIGKGESVIGKSIQLDNFPGRIITIGAVFEDVPENTHLKYDVAISMVSFKSFHQFDSTEGWLGSDRYLGYVKLAQGVTPEKIAPSLRSMQERHQDLVEMQKSGVDFYYSLLPLTEVHSGKPEAKRMSVLLGLLAFALMFTAVMNYILIVLSSLVTRSKVIAIHKCYGATGKNIRGMVLSETFLHLLVSLLLAIFMLFLFRGTVEEILDTSLGALLTFQSSLILAGVCLLVLGFTGLVPAHFFIRIPVASAFRKYKESRRNWKLGLLFIQFLATAFLITLLVIIGLQYNLMVNDDPGYSYENLLYSYTEGVSDSDRQKALDELRALPEVESAASCNTLPVYSGSGNNVFIPGNDQQLFNINDLYFADENYLKLMNIKLVAGIDFNKETSQPDHVMVSQSFSDKISGLLNWKDGVLGKTFIITEHGTVTVTGIYANIRASSISNPDNRPTVLFYKDTPSEYLLVKLHRLSSDNIQKVSEVLEESMPGKDIVVTPYKSSMIDLYKDARLFRNSVLIGGIVTLLIALIGLIGYTNDEIHRRSAEIAVRKINGATIQNIQRLFLKDILRIALPAIVLGGGVAAYAATEWMEDFSEKTEFSPLLFFACGLVVLLIILSIVSINSFKASVQNPIKWLRNS
ncbi:MAG: ABC transporter permease [Porphyromonadaceae bacterium]|nr:ABC transporter permease [Porphyromonadaceae bacterium]